jgi:hypothetical protein
MANAGRASGDLLNDFVLDIFRLNRLFTRRRPSGLSTARWQVRRAVLHKPLTVACLCKFSPKPAHRRAKLLLSTDQGLDCVKQLRPKVIAWARRLRKQVGGRTLDAAMTSVESLLAAISKAKHLFVAFNDLF